MSLTTEQKRANLEALAGKLSRITGEKIEIQLTPHCFRFFFPLENFLLHETVRKCMTLLLCKTSELEKNGLLIYIKAGKIIIHTSTI